MYHGYILAAQKDAAYLESLGIMLGDYNRDCRRFDECDVSKEVFEKLFPLWGKFRWALSCM